MFESSESQAKRRDSGTERVSRNGERENRKGQSNPSKRHSEQARVQIEARLTRGRADSASDAWATRGSMLVN